MYSGLVLFFNQDKTVKLELSLAAIIWLAAAGLPIQDCLSSRQGAKLKGIAFQLAGPSQLDFLHLAVYRQLEAGAFSPGQAAAHQADGLCQA